MFEISHAIFFRICIYVCPTMATGSRSASAKVQYSLLSVERESGVAEVCRELGVRSLVQVCAAGGAHGGNHGKTHRKMMKNPEKRGH